MSTRKIKNARDLETNELIYFKSHAQATFMSDGSTVEDVINEIKETGGADLTDYVTTAQLNTSLSGKQDTINDLADIRSGASKGATAVQPASLSTVATSGSYNDLSNKPTIPTAVTINNVNKTISSNKINIGTIPTAVTINNSTKTGSTIALGTVVTGVTMNGSTKTVSNGKVDLGTIITAHQTLKTINGESIVGSGDITISGGLSDANVMAVDTGDVLDDVNVDYATTAYVDGLVGDVNSVLENIIGGSVSNTNKKYILWTEDGLQFGGGNNIAQPNVKYICTTPITQIVFGDISKEEWHGGTTEPYGEYTFIFECNNTSIEMPTSILWANGSQPTLENGVRYELSVSLMYINNEYIGHAVLVPFKTV